MAETDTSLTPEEKKKLLGIARDTIEKRANGERPVPPEEASGALSESRGAFVTLHKHGHLRGCIGCFVGEGPLAETIQRMAISAGWEDPRFPPVRKEEVDDIDIEISVLSPLREIDDVSEIEVGRHGIYITKGFYRGVLLPQVATEQGWDRDTFLSHTCIKAGLSPDAWKNKDLKIEVFTAEIFGELENR